MIWTFYSAERRVGRSMALANVAELCRRRGNRAVIIDWDLQAPGLEWLFPDERRDIEERPGLIDLLLDYKAEMTRPIAETGDYPTLPTAYLDADLTTVRHDVAPDRGACNCSPPGDAQARRISMSTPIVWPRSIRLNSSRTGKCYRFFDELRGRLLEAADVVLTDRSAGCRHGAASAQRYSLM